MDRFEEFAGKVTANHTKTAYALKCDVRKFFDNIDHEILLSLISRKIDDDRLIRLISQVIESFETKTGIGLPLGNVTSQICSNICLNELDQYAKHGLKAEYYIRYCDDFVIVHHSREFLERCISKIGSFLRDRLKLELHPNKVSIRKIHNGVDFLGFVSLPHYRVMRTKTKRRMMRKIEELAIRLQRGLVSEEYFNQVVTSYKGMLTHCKGEKLKEQINAIIYGG